MKYCKRCGEADPTISHECKCQNCGDRIPDAHYHVFYTLGCTMRVGECCVKLFEENGK